MRQVCDGSRIRHAIPVWVSSPDTEPDGQVSWVHHVPCPGCENCRESETVTHTDVYAPATIPMTAEMESGDVAEPVGDEMCASLCPTMLTIGCELPRGHEGHHKGYDPERGHAYAWPNAPTPTPDRVETRVTAASPAEDGGAFVAHHFHNAPVFVISESDGVKGHDLALTWSKVEADRIALALNAEAAIRDDEARRWEAQRDRLTAQVVESERQAEHASIHETEVEERLQEAVGLLERWCRRWVVVGGQLRVPLWGDTSRFLTRLRGESGGRA